MKTIFLTFCLFFLTTFTFVLRAQIWGETKSVWYYNNPPLMGNPISDFYKMESTRDTIINSKVCKIISNSLRKEYMYEDSGLVYYWENGHYRLIYNFKANPNDTILLTYRAELPGRDTILEVKVVIDSVKPIYITQLTLKRFFIHTIPDTLYPDLVWPSLIYTERIGSENMLIDILRRPSVLPSVSLRCYTDNETNYVTSWWNAQNKPCDFKIVDGIASETENKSTVNIQPDPTLNNVWIETSGQIGAQLLLMDFTGKTLCQKTITQNKFYLDTGYLPAGIYFILIINKKNYLQFINKIIKL